MYEKVQAMFKASSVGDAERKRAAHILQVITLALSVGLALLVLTRIAIGDFFLVPAFMVVWSIVIVSMILSRKGGQDLAGSLLLWTLLGFTTFLMLTGDGLHDLGLVAIPGILVAASLLLRKRHFFLFTAMALLLVLLIGTLEISGEVRNRFSVRTDGLEILDLLVILAITGMTVRLLSDRLVQSLARAQGAAEEARRNVEQLKESEERYRTLFESANDAIFILADGRFTECNAMALKMYGCERESDLIGHSPVDFSPSVQPDGRSSEDAAKGYIEAACSGVPQRFHWKHVRRNGDLFDAEVSLSVLQIARRQVLQALVRDVSERRVVEGELRRSEASLNAFVNALSEPSFLLDTDARFVAANDALAGSIGKTREELLGKCAYDFLDPATVDVRKPKIDQVIRSGTGIQFEDERAGRHFVNLIRPVLDPHGSTTRIAVLALDITERKAVEQELRRSEERLRFVIEASNHGIWNWNLVTDHVQWSDQVYQMLMIPKASFDGTFETLKGMVHPDDLTHLTDAVDDHLVRSLPFDIELRLRRGDGSYGYYLCRGKSMTEGSGQPHRMIGSIEDITQSKHSKKKIEEQARLLDVARDAIIVRDMSDSLVYMNRAAEQLYGWTFEEAQSIPSELLIADIDRARFMKDKQEFLQRGDWEGELRQRTRDGRELVILARWTLVRDDMGTPAARLIINRDITEQRRLEAQFRRAQRLESLGTLAGGIAHDLNNVLAPIMMAIALLDRKITDPALKKQIASLEKSAQRGSDIVKQVLLFARGSEKDFTPQQLRYAIREIGNLISETFPRSIELRTDAAKDLKFVMGDATQIGQVLMNLCVNARDAMPSGGKLVIAASNITLDESECKERRVGSPGEYVLLSVSDSGMGIPKDLQEKIFEPFFTTKDLGKGTGLGLSTVYSIIRDHGGHINLYSEVGKGSRFDIYLPAIHHEEVVHKSIEHEAPPLGKNETILIVDDERSVLEITKETLEAHGYRAIGAEDGHQAIALFSLRPRGSIDLVLTDINMPSMDGLEVAEALLNIDPGVKIILASGLLTDVDQAKLSRLSIRGFLNKPYSSKRMLSAIRDVLQERSPL